LIRLFLDEIGPEALLAAANDPKLRRKRQQVCEANFYMGQLALARHGADEAAILFRRVASECPRSLNEWGAAVAELKALGLVR
jgi:hypothetical protein